jgi:hypothetical protein
LQAIERIWTACRNLLPFANLANRMGQLKLEEIAEISKSKPQVREIFKILTASIKDPEKRGNEADYEEPYVSALSWALFDAYRLIVRTAYAQATILAQDIDDPLSFLDEEKVKNVLIAVLPHQKSFIENHKLNVLHHLLEEIEKLLLRELKHMLDGVDQDQVDIDAAKKISDTVNEAQRAASKKEASSLLSANNVNNTK